MIKNKTSFNHIIKYYKNHNKTLQYGRTKQELAIRTDFINLINDYAIDANLRLIPELSILGTLGKQVRPDGVLKNSFSFNFGIWESKDLDDDIENEIFNKISVGYPIQNTLFENSKKAILYQDNSFCYESDINNPEQLHEILFKFIYYKPSQILDYDKALTKFKEDIPHIIDDLRCIIDEQSKNNHLYIQMQKEFLDICKIELNPYITIEDIREIIIQHLLTYEIFSSIFSNLTFHSTNNIATTIEKIITKALPSTIRQELLLGINSYYKTIKMAASNIVGHKDKQKFLKIFYEDFYKAYNPAAADKLGIVYTPNEIVDFMINFTDELLYENFGKNLFNNNVNILDPATGTGTFIVDLIEYIPVNFLMQKYKNEIFANEVSILPYYIANLNIEYTFYEKMGYHEEFPNICFVDTLDNTKPLRFSGQQSLSAETLSYENSKRIAHQNNQKISVIIGNPPYNANQQNYNDFNKNREYPIINKRIKDTFVRYSKSKKSKVYDMYSKFYRWAMDRIDDNGIVAFITNRSFIDAKGYDGFRKCIEKEFDFIYIIDTKSDRRSNKKIAGTTHNVFGISTGIAIMFLIKNKNFNKQCQIKYFSLDDDMLKEEKLQWLQNNNLSNIDFVDITPDKEHNWVNAVQNNFNTLIPLFEKNNDSIFNFSSLGVSTNRDEWVTDFSIQNLENKVKYLSSNYNNSIKSKTIDKSIKWSDSLNRSFEQEKLSSYSKNHIVDMEARPFIVKKYYCEKIFSDRLTQNHYTIFGEELNNYNLLINYNKRENDNSSLITNKISDLHLIGDSQCFPLYTYDKENNKIENISDWGLNLFQKYYKNTDITKENIFSYIYSILHSEKFKEKYKINLSRELPKIPLFENFLELSSIGCNLINLHSKYLEINPYSFTIVDELSKSRNKQKYIVFEDNTKGLLNDVFGSIKVLLRADKNKNCIYIDKQITLENIPSKVWEYKIAGKSAIEWILDQYKFKKSKDNVINLQFNNYNFSRHRDKVIELIARICTLSIETIDLVEKIDIIIIGESFTNHD